MISGGLDSTLALALVRRQGIAVKAITFYTGLCITETQRRKGGRADGTVPRNEALRAAADLEVDIEYVDISGAGYLDMLVHPRYGYGANANPCVDCRIFMMRKAKEIMEAEGADFVFTGEVLGQRPKSQRRDTLRIIERESGLDGRLLAAAVGEAPRRPPSPSRRGSWTASGSRRSAAARASASSSSPRELGVTDFPQPAGGCCYLTDESFARKFFDVLDAREAAGEERRLVAGRRRSCSPPGATSGSRRARSSSSGGPRSRTRSSSTTSPGAPASRRRACSGRSRSSRACRRGRSGCSPPRSSPATARGRTSRGRGRVARGRASSRPTRSRPSRTRPKIEALRV